MLFQLSEDLDKLQQSHLAEIKSHTDHITKLQQQLKTFYVQSQQEVKGNFGGKTMSDLEIALDEIEKERLLLVEMRSQFEKQKEAYLSETELVRAEFQREFESKGSILSRGFFICVSIFFVIFPIP